MKTKILADFQIWISVPLNSNNDFIFFWLTSKDFHMTTTPEYLSEFSSFYVKFTEETYWLSACKRRLYYYIASILNPFMFSSVIACQTVENFHKRWTIGGTQFLVKYLDFISSVSLKM